MNPACPERMNRKQFFDMHAKKWDTFVAMGLMHRIKRDIVPYLGIKKGFNILDVGCGTGILLPLLKARAGSNGEITALDYSKPMIKQAKEKYGSGYKYLCAKAEDTGLKKNTYDLAVCFSAFPHFPNKLKALKELLRILKPGGKIVIAHVDSRENINSFHTGVGGPVAHDHMPDNQEMLMFLKKSGFKTIRIIDEKKYYIACGYK